MGTSKSSKNSVHWPLDAADPDVPEDKDAGALPAGRIEHDDRGNAVWKSGASDSTSAMLRKLVLPELKIEGQEDELPPASKAQAAPVKGSRVAAPKPDMSGGYNPYDQDKAVRKPSVPKAPVVRKK